MLIEGPPGIGKSRLMAEFRRRAIADGALVLNARAGELEREFPFGVVRQLFEAVVADPDALAGRRRARARRLRRAPRRAHRPAATRRFAALHGLYWLALNLAAERPLLLEIDDLHWCDRPSLRFLAYLVRRLEGQPVLVTASRAHRRRADRRRAAGRDRQRSRDRPRPARARCREEAVGALVARRLGAEPDRAFREACHSTTGGNPLLVRQLLNALETDARQARRRPRRRRARDRLARGLELGPAAARAAARRGGDRRPRRRRARRGRRPARRRRRRRARRGAGRGHDGRARPRRDPAPRAAARLRAPARPRRRLHGPPARRARAAARARRRRPAADSARRWTRSPASSCTRRGAATPRSRAAAARGRRSRRSRAARSTTPSATCGARSRSRRRPPTAPRLLLDLGEVEALTRGPDGRPAPARGLRRPDRRPAAASAPRTRSAARCCSPSSPAEGAAVAREAARALPPELADEALGAARRSR